MLIEKAGDESMKPHLDWDREADAIYIRLRRGEYSHGEDLDPERRVDFDSEGHPIGAEFLCVESGVNLDNLPERGKLERVLEEHGIKGVRLLR